MVFGHILRAASDEAKKETVKRKNSFYWVKCPACGRRVIKNELKRKGCYICGWKDTEVGLEIAESKSVRQPGKVGNLDRNAGGNSYRINCPNCGTQVITQQLQEKGCYICGWKEKQ